MQNIILFIITALFSIEIIAGPGPFEQTKAPSFASFSPAPRTIGGVRYPLNAWLYRGTSNKKLSLEEAIRGMFGHSDQYLMSTLFKAIRKALMKKNPKSSYKIINSDAYYQERGDEQIIAMIKEAKSQYPKGKIPDWKVATAFTKNIIDRYWRLRSSAQDLGNYIDYNSVKAPKLMTQARPPYSNYFGHGKIDWPTKVLFSTVQPHTAGEYGKTVAIYQDKDNRSLDLGFWNYTHNKIWSKAAADVGEFVVPGYIAANNLVGLELRKSSGTKIKASKTGGLIPRLQEIYNLIEYGFYRSTILGKPYILVFSGRSPDNHSLFGQEYYGCIKKVSEVNYRYCNIYKSKKGQPAKLPQASAVNAALLGVIALCNPNSLCSLPEIIKNSFTGWRGRAKAPKLPKKAWKILKPGNEKIVINGKVARYFTF